MHLLSLIRGTWTGRRGRVELRLIGLPVGHRGVPTELSRKSSLRSLETGCFIWEREGQGVICECAAACHPVVPLMENRYCGFTDEENETFTGASSRAA